MVPAANARRILGLAIGITAATGLQAGDLVDTYERARTEDPQFAQAMADYRAAQEQWPQARAGVLPRLDVSASTAEVETEDNNSGRTNDYDEDTIRVELRQPLFDWQAFTELDRAEAAVARAEAELAAAKQELVIRVAEAYFNVLTAREAYRFAQAEQRAVKRQLEQARERFNVGLIPVTDVKEAQASYDLAVSRALETQNNLGRAREALRKITGRRVESLAGTIDEIPLESPQPADQSAWVDRALENNPDYLSARSAAEAARHQVRQARAGYYPSVEVFARRTERDSATIDNTEDRIGVELTWNLFNGGATYAQNDQARAEFQRAQAAVTEARRSVGQRTRDAYRALASTRAQVEALRQGVESSRARVEATRSGFEVGTRTSVDVLNAVRDLYRGQRDLSEARNNYIVNRLRLQQATGTLADEDVRRVNAWLERGERESAGDDGGGES
jgi:outer membrane protein